MVEFNDKLRIRETEGVHSLTLRRDGILVRLPRFERERFDVTVRGSR
jgi:hypothetical protein